MLSDNETIKLYMQHIAEYERVTPKEEIDLAARIQKGEEKARVKLVRSNLRLVVKIAHDFKGRGLPLLDLISEGNIGLMRAVDKFDPSKGAKLSSYAAWWIKQCMRRALANQSRTVRIPIQSATKISKIHNARIKLREKLNREPENSEIAEEVQLTERTVSQLGRVSTTTFSLHDPIQQGEEGEFHDILPDPSTPTPDNVVQEDETMRRMMHLVQFLDERERGILTLRYGLNGERPHTLEEVSRIIGPTRERIRQLQHQAVRKLRLMLDEEREEEVESAGEEEEQKEDATTEAA